MHQTTIKRSIECSGIGLHSGRKVRLKLLPAPEDTGIIFSLLTGRGARFITPRPDAVVATGLSTTLVHGEDSVSTVEHLLAAVRGLGIDNIHIEIEGGEAPIMDGSAASFVFLLRSAGIVRQTRPRKYLALKRPFELQRDGKWVKGRPGKGFFVDFTIDFNHPLIGTQHMSFDLSPDEFIRHVAKARTFGFLRDVEALQRNGLARGGSLDNAVVLDDYAVVNPEGLRFDDEFVRHKILDFIGDMALLEFPLLGRFEVHCSGHALNNAFLRILDANRDIYLHEVTLPDARQLPQEADPVLSGAAMPVPS